MISHQKQFSTHPDVIVKLKNDHFSFSSSDRGRTGRTHGPDKVFIVSANPCIEMNGPWMTESRARDRKWREGFRWSGSARLICSFPPRRLRQENLLSNFILLGFNFPLPPLSILLTTCEFFHNTFPDKHLPALVNQFPLFASLMVFVVVFFF